MRLCYLALVPIAFGHDMWIEPATFRPQAGQVVGVKLRVGEDLLGDPIPRTASLIREFVFADAAGRNAVEGREGRDPAGYVRLARSGVAVIGYNSHASAAELTAGKFDAYLKEEGLERILAARQHRPPDGALVRELFVRCAKSLLASGPAGGDRELGFPLELVSEQNPYAARGQDQLPFRLTYGQQPVADVLVVAFNRADPARKIRARTDRNGRVRLRLPGDGMWLVKAVHMVPAPAGAGAEWVSYWASLTFARGGK